MIMTDQCQCPKGMETPQGLGPSLSTRRVGEWQAIPESSGKATEHVLRQCECGCNTYQGTSPIGPTDVDSLDIPALPIRLEYEDDDASDDLRYVEIPATQFADMLSAIRSCTCQNH